MQEKLRVVSQDVLKAGSGLAGGVARHGETCGALTGAILAVCCLVGRENLQDLDQYSTAMEKAALVYDKFREAVGHTICSEIHKLRYGRAFRLNLPEDRIAFQEAGGHSRKGCPEVCGIAARIGASVILDLKEKSS